MNHTLLQVGPVVFAAAILIAVIRSGRLDPTKIGLKAATGPWVIFLLTYVLYLGFSELIAVRTGLVTREVNPWRYGTLETSIRIVGIVLVTPFVEETIFRGVLLWKLKERAGLAIAVAGQAIIFTAFHAMSLVGSTTFTFDIAQPLVEGAYFGWVRSKTGSLYPSMAMHGLGNAVAVMERLLLA